MAQFRTTQDVSATTAGISTYAEVVRLTANSAGSSNLYLPDVGNSPIIGRGHSIIIVAAASGITVGPNIKPNPSDTGFEIDGVTAKAYTIEDRGLMVTYVGDGKWTTSMSSADSFRIIINDSFENGENNILVPTGSPNAALTTIRQKYEDSRFYITSTGAYGGATPYGYFNVKPSDSTNYPDVEAETRWQHGYQEIAGVAGSGGVETIFINFPVRGSGGGFAEGGQHLVELSLTIWDTGSLNAYYHAQIYIMVEVDQLTFGSQIINTENWTIMQDTGDYLVDLVQAVSTTQLIGVQIDNNSGTDSVAHAAYRIISSMNLTI